MECYSGPKSNELPTHEKTWRSLKCLLLTGKVNLKRLPAVVALSLVLRELQIKTMRNHLFSLIIMAKLQKVNNTHSVTEATGEQELSSARGNVPWKEPLEKAGKEQLSELICDHNSTPRNLPCRYICTHTK